jgi:hypothetical protein
MIGDQHIKGGLYYNANGYACAIVTVISEGIDWAAYMGGCPNNYSWDEAYYFVAKNGSKIPKTLAKFLFPEIKLPYRE